MNDMQQCAHTTRHRLLALLCFLLIALYGCSDSKNPPVAAPPMPGDEPTTVGTYPRVKFGDCPFNASTNATEIRCGVLETYENYELTGPDARIIEVAFGIIPATTTPKAPDPIVVFIGGPGASALAEFALDVPFEPYTSNRDLILVDQRGAGFSNPFLNCDIPDEGNIEEAAKQCVAGYEQTGVDLTQYHTAVIARDFKELRQALEIPQWNLYGESYGPTPGIINADLDVAGVRSVIFDSSTGNQVDIALADAAAPLDYITEMAIQCATETECATRLPDVRSVFIDTFRSLSDDPWTVNIPGEEEFNFDGQILFNLIYDIDAVQFPSVLEIFANRDLEKLQNELFENNSTKYRSSWNRPYNRNISNNRNTNTDPDVLVRAEGANLMGILVLCTAIDVENYNSAILPTREQWPDDLIETARELVDFPQVCASGLVPFKADLSQREPRSLNVPALIMGGALDPIVSLKQVMTLAESFEEPRLAIVPKGGHVVGFPTRFINPCSKTIAAAFLDNPNVAPDTSCLTQNIEPFRFSD